jgi:hypothetical protein
LAGRFNPRSVEEIINGIPDSEIRAFERVAVANSLVGAQFMELPTVEKHKNAMRLNGL